MVIRAPAISLGIVLLVAPSIARADSDAELRAQALYDQGEALMKQGRYAEACSKYTESQAVAPSGGTVLHLAECLDKSGKPAEAIGFFQEAKDLAHTAGKADIERYAEGRIATLDAEVAHVTITVAGTVTGEVVQVDDALLPTADWGKPHPVDPGDHVVTASAPGRAAFTLRMRVAARENRAALVPVLSNEATGSGQRYAGIAIGTAGLASLVVGAAFGGLAIKANNDALLHCRTSTLCSQLGLDETKDALLKANVSTGTLVAGGVLVAVGTTVFLTAPRAASTRTGQTAAPFLAAGAEVGPSYGVASLRGSF
jgi:tetratricopeptide (TPR) repeat protein